MEKAQVIPTYDIQTAQHFIKTFSDTTREPMIILDKTLVVFAANASFYKTFQVTKEETENKRIYDLGNKQWDIPELKKLLEEILPKERVFNDYEISHKFPDIGNKIMLLNARQLDNSELILLAIEDVTLKRTIETDLANYTKELEKGINETRVELSTRVDELSRLNTIMVGREVKMAELKKEIVELKKDINS